MKNKNLILLMQIVWFVGATLLVCLITVGIGFFMGAHL